jgi:preprotein translocase subunit SecA
MVGIDAGDKIIVPADVGDAPVLEALAWKQKRKEMQAGAKSRPRSRMTSVAREKLGRNDPCYCGSGLKYKKCHGK